jgi:hypothetical protein
MGTDDEADDKHTEADTVARREAALKRMLSTSPKPHSEMKIGKGRAKPKKDPASLATKKPRK